MKTSCGHIAADEAYVHYAASILISASTTEVTATLNDDVFCFTLSLYEKCCLTEVVCGNVYVYAETGGNRFDSLSFRWCYVDFNEDATAFECVRCSCLNMQLHGDR